MIGAVAKQSSVLNETKVSSESRFSDIEWQMARGVSGYPDTTFRIDWAFVLPDGSGFDEGRWDKLRYAAKAFIWSLHSDPPRGYRGTAPRTLPVMTGRLRQIIRWMVAEGIERFADLDRETVLRFFEDRLSHGELSSATAQAYLHVLHAFYHQREKIADAPPKPPARVRDLGDGWRERGGWPFTPDAIAVPLISSALRMLEEADSLLTVRDGAQARYDEHVRAGGTCRTGRSRAREWIVEHKPGLPGISKDMLARTPLWRLDHLIARLRDACFITIAYLVGARSSEILALETDCIEWSRDSAGERVPYLVGAIRKGASGVDGVPHRWVAPEPVIRAVEIVSWISAPLRERTGRRNLWLSQVPPGGALIYTIVEIVPVTHQAIYVALNRHYRNVLPAPEQDGKDWLFGTHQGRKTFARFVGRRDRTGLAALRKHLGHINRAMTDSAYVGTDFELTELIDEQTARETRAALEELLVAPRLGGKAGRTIAARSPFRGRTLDEDLDRYITRLLAETDMRLGVCDWGYCLYRRETAACFGSDVAPNPALRTQSTCVTCANFVLSDKHRPIWEDRIARNRVLLQREDLDDASRALAQARVEEGERLLASLAAQEAEG